VLQSKLSNQVFRYIFHFCGVHFEFQICGFKEEDEVIGQFRIVYIEELCVFVCARATKHI
jgi:hypothetical protein